MASVFFIICISLFTSLAFSALIFPLVIRARFVSLPRSFFVTQLVLALLVRPLVDVATCIWHLLPVFLILPTLPTLIVWFLAYLVYSFVTLCHANYYLASDLIHSSLPLLSPFDIDEDVEQSWKLLITSINDFMERANFTEIFQNIVIGTSEPQPDLSKAFEYGFYHGFATTSGGQGFDDVRNNLTISHQTQHFIDTINVALIDFLENAQVENVLKVTRIPSDLFKSLQTVTETLHLFAKELNFTTIIKQGTVSSSAGLPFIRLVGALSTATGSIDVDELRETALLLPALEMNSIQSEKDKLVLLLSNPSQFFMSGGAPNDGFPLKQFALTFLTSYWPHILFVSLLLFVGIPLVFLLRAALQDACLWLVTRRYKSVIPSSQRSVSGWMFVAAISGLALAATEALPFCCMLFYLHFSIPNLKPLSTVFLIFHTLSGAPLRAASHMRIAEGVAENDILNERESGLRKGVVVSSLFNGTFSVWWLLSSVVLILSYYATELFFWVALVMDVFIVGSSIAWSRGICRRVVAKEQQWQEEQHRKRD